MYGASSSISSHNHSEVNFLFGLKSRYIIELSIFSDVNHVVAFCFHNLCFVPAVIFQLREIPLNPLPVRKIRDFMSLLKVEVLKRGRIIKTRPTGLAGPAK